MSAFITLILFWCFYKSTNGLITQENCYSSDANIVKHFATHFGSDTMYPMTDKVGNELYTIPGKYRLVKKKWTININGKMKKDVVHQKFGFFNDMEHGPHSRIYFKKCILP